MLRANLRSTIVIKKKKCPCLESNLHAEPTCTQSPNHSVALLPRALHFKSRSPSLCSLGLRASSSHSWSLCFLGLCALHSHQNLRFSLAFAAAHGSTIINKKTKQNKTKKNKKNKKHSENADTSTSVTFDLVV